MMDYSSKEEKPGDFRDVEAIPTQGDLAEGNVSHLKRSLKGRHMQMIAIGGSIGAGLFVGAGGALSAGGPGSLVIDFIITGIMMLFTVNALGELAAIYPVAGAFYNYSVRFIDPSWGFAMGWNYAMNWLVVLPFELTTAGVTISFWTNGSINVGVWITIFLVLVIAINIFGVRGYGEVEFVLGVIKVAAVIGFIILGIIIDCGGVPTDTRGYLGFTYWGNPGAFQNGFKGFCAVFVTASFSFGGTELVGLAAAEADNPHKTIPKATKQVFWRISLFYVISLLLLGMIISSTDSDLSKATGSGDTKYSPFVLAIQRANIQVLPSIFNAVITISVISVANSCSFAATRTIHALCDNGMGPRIFSKIDSKGRPWVALLLVLAFGFLAYINEAPQGGQIFTWLLALSGLSNFFTWGSINYAHIRFRKAMKLQGRSLDELPFTAMFGVYGSWLGLLLNILCLIAQFYVALFPIGGSPDAEVFFESYLAAPVVLLFYVGHKLWTRNWRMQVPLISLDLDEGRRDIGLAEELAAERAEKATWPWWKRAWDWLA